MSTQNPSNDAVPVRSFYGRYQRGLDKKGRAILPANFREILGDESIFITKGIEKCLWLIPESEFERLRGKMKELSQTSGKARNFKRRFFTQSFNTKPDSIGRINIPPHLRKYAGLEGDVVFAGVDDYIELWDAETWQRHEEELDDEAMQQAWESLNI